MHYKHIASESAAPARQRQRLCPSVSEPRRNGNNGAVSAPATVTHYHTRIPAASVLSVTKHLAAKPHSFIIVPLSAQFHISLHSITTSRGFRESTGDVQTMKPRIPPDVIRLHNLCFLSYIPYPSLDPVIVTTLALNKPFTYFLTYSLHPTST